MHGFSKTVFACLWRVVNFGQEKPKELPLQKHNLDPVMHEKSGGVILSIHVKFDVERDKVSVDVALRNDLTDEGLLARAASQVEHALRSKSAFYAIELQKIEQMAGLPATTMCGCTDESHNEPGRGEV